TASRYNFAQIGHGGYGNGAVEVIDGAISVTSSDSVTLLGGTAATSFAHIGHGGLGLNSFMNGSFAGNVTVKAGAAILLQGGTQDYAFAMIGNGGAGVKGPASGEVLV